MSSCNKVSSDKKSEETETEPTYQCPYCDITLIEVDCSDYVCNSCGWGNCDGPIEECIEFVKKCLEKYNER